MKSGLMLVHALLSLNIVFVNSASGQQTCADYGIGSVHLDATTQANYVMEACDSASSSIRMITVWSGVSRTPPQAPPELSNAHKLAIRSFVSDELKGYVSGGMLSAGGAWFLSVNKAGAVAVAYTDGDAQGHVVSRHELLPSDAVLVVFIEHRPLPDSAVIVGTEVVIGRMTLPRKLGVVERQTAAKALLTASLSGSPLWPRQLRR